MKFTNKIKTNWHDTDAHRNVRASKIVEYMQETANAQCESSGLPLEKLRDERGLAFILGALSINIYSPLHAYEEIEVRTWCKEAKSYIFNRYFEIYRGDEKIAEASSTWVLIDLNTKSMVRASSCEFMSGCFYYDDPIDPSILPPKPRLPKDATLYEVGKRKIVYSDIDYNMHMNNTHYPDMICDFLEEMTDETLSYRVASLALSYIKESHLGATLTVYRSQIREDDTVDIRTVNEDMQICLEASVRFARSDMIEIRD
ncbi:MAG: hypothetical protein IJD74_06600 [Clostridia bacterium]|nr:hypothetical protein [Clostridia bacterium]